MKQQPEALLFVNQQEALLFVNVVIRRVIILRFIPLLFMLTKLTILLILLTLTFFLSIAGIFPSEFSLSELIFPWADFLFVSVLSSGLAVFRRRCTSF